MRSTSVESRPSETLGVLRNERTPLSGSGAVTTFPTRSSPTSGYPAVRSRPVGPDRSPSRTCAIVSTPDFTIRPQSGHSCANAFSSRAPATWCVRSGYLLFDCFFFPARRTTGEQPITEHGYPDDRHNDIARYPQSDPSSSWRTSATNRKSDATTRARPPGEGWDSSERFQTRKRLRPAMTDVYSVRRDCI